MPTRYLISGLISPTEYVSWDDCRRSMARRRSDQVTLAELIASIPEDGVIVPVKIGVSDQDYRLYVGDGHHRAVAVMELEEPWFPFEWYWIRAFGVHREREPFPVDLLGGVP